MLKHVPPPCGGQDFGLGKVYTSTIRIFGIGPEFRLSRLCPRTLRVSISHSHIFSLCLRSFGPGLDSRGRRRQRCSLDTTGECGNLFAERDPYRVQKSQADDTLSFETGRHPLSPVFQVLRAATFTSFPQLVLVALPALRKALRSRIRTSQPRRTCSCE